MTEHTTNAARSLSLTDTPLANNFVADAWLDSEPANDIRGAGAITDASNGV